LSRIPLTPLRRNRDFLLLQRGQLFSTTGTSTTQIAYPLLVLATTHSPAKAGIVGFANILPYALFALFAGVVADRWNRKHVMILMDVTRALGALSIVVALAADALTFAHICIVAFLEGSAFVFFNIAEVGALRSVVPPKQLPDAATLTVSGPDVAPGTLIPILAESPSIVRGALTFNEPGKFELIFTAKVDGYALKIVRTVVIPAPGGGGQTIDAGKWL